jgi:hypothetical protein
MRRNILWAIAVVSAGTALAQAQQGPPAGAVVTLPTSIPNGATPTNPTLGNPVFGAPITQDCFRSCDPPLRAWISADYLLWWTKSGPLNTPLVTTGSQSDIPPGALGQPGTRVLYGDQAIGYGTLSGIRLNAGFALNNWLDLEGGYFALQTGVNRFSAGSNAAGSPLITRPFFNNQLGVEDSLATSDPNPAVGPWAGSTSVSSHSELQGWELNLATRTQINDRLTAGLIGGFRAMSLNEDLIIRDHVTPLTTGILNVETTTVNPPSSITDFDSFTTRNSFYGGQIGGRLDWQNNNWFIGVLGKVALGVTQQIVSIDGATSLLTPGAPTATVPGGVLALPSNMGNHYRSAFSVVPEAGLTLGWNISPNIKATVGYTFIYWTNVARPGAQIDSNLNPAHIPSDQVFGNGMGGNRPTFSFHESDYWAQGINFGLQFKF